MMVCYRLSFRRLLVGGFTLFSMLVYIHFLFVSSTGKSRMDYSSSGQSETINTTTIVIQSTNITKQSTLTEETVTMSSLNVMKRNLWFFKNGTIKPKPATVDEHGKRRATLWAREAGPRDDRIIDQLMYVPPNYTDESPLKNIVIYPNMNDWAEPGQQPFLKCKCPVNRCNITDNMNLVSTADSIIFRSSFPHTHHERPPNQIWILYLLESPYHTNSFRYNDAINWTATYRRDSDIVTPYGYWVYYDDNVKQLKKPLKDYARNKTRKVAWFVSNCGAKNNRLKYAKELQKYIDVDIYGQCSTLKCPRVERCFNLLKNEYKFYLAFENSNCIDYITEKFFYNGLEHDVVPIAMGARPEDYEMAAPEHSYIHVDNFESPQKLAEYLHMLDRDDDLYNSYFLWKGTGEFINTYSLCRICAMLHDDTPVNVYPNINRWWSTQDQCASGSWNQAE